MKKTVAFLQNMWMRDPERGRAAYAVYGESWRRRAVYQFLFAGCVTGRRIRAAFGDLVEAIEWDETTTEIAGDPRKILPAQPAHIASVIERHKSAIVLCFGNISRKAVLPIAGRLGVGTIVGPHPAARQSDVPARLAQMARLLREATK